MPGELDRYPAAVNVISLKGHAMLFRCLYSGTASTALVSLFLVFGVATGCSDDTSGGNDDSFNLSEGDADLDDADEGESDADAPSQDVELPEDTGQDDAGEEPAAGFNPYEAGEYDVLVEDVSAGPADFIVFYPQQTGSYPVVVYQHGMLMNNAHYSQLLTHVASHGFIVVAPQMYPPGDNPLAAPDTEDEVELANELYDWLHDELDAHIDATADTDRFALAGHSRGAKVIWWALREQPRTVDAVAGVDPVDGTGGPFGNEPQITDDPPDIDAPTLLIGAGLGGESAGFGPACAPDGENYEEFFAVSSSPAWQIVAPEYGHLDMLDDSPEGCGFSCDACVDGPSRAPMRQLTGGLLVALFRATLYDDSSALDWLEDEQAAPVTVDIVVK